MLKTPINFGTPIKFLSYLSKIFNRNSSGTCTKINCLCSSGYRQDQRVVREGCGEGRGELGDAERAAHEVRGYRYVFQAHSSGTYLYNY